MANRHLLLFGIAASLLSQPSAATLLTNGGFEQPDLDSGWTAQQDPSGGWQGDNIEVWASGFLGVDSAEGSQHGELNAHPKDGTSWNIYQEFDTVAGIPYRVNFAYRARKSEAERFNFLLTDSNTTIFDIVLKDHTTTQWSYFSAPFIGTGEVNKIEFTSIRPREGTRGNFLDDVSVTPSPVATRFFSLRSIIPISEPPLWAIFSLGLLAMAGAYRFKRTRH